MIIDWLGGHCPVQAEGTIDGTPFYFRSRGERWSFSVGTGCLITEPDWRYEEPYGGRHEAGWITADQALAFVKKAARLYWNRDR